MIDFKTLKDEEYRLTSRLSNLEISRRAVFAAACAERLYPLFEQYCEANGISSHIQLRHALDRLWASIDTPMPDEELQKMAEKGLESDNAGINTIDLVLNAANMEKGLVKYEMKRTDFEDIVLKTFSEKKIPAETKGLEIEKDIKEDDYYVDLHASL